LRDIRELSEKVEQSKERTGNFNLLKFEEIDFINPPIETVEIVAIILR